ncbi:hypothetical protein HMPREF0005_02404 [Achromobacter xylosoxidans C54]|nr:hypothetical protein HMPREF0005_02404 [Achromobacter xylosoxidans C54]
MRTGQADLDPPRPALVHRAHPHRGVLQARERGAHVIQERRAGLGQGHPAVGAVEQLDLQLAFELGDLQAQRRLRDMQPGGSAGEVEFFGQHGEITELADFHGGQ